ncbi:MAG: MFS transporter [Gammaproteobacteria bacterium]|nr:MFS transporter [Gammaproteobacteria bacterium]
MPAHFLAFLGGSALINLVTTALSVAVGWHIYEHSGNPMDLAIVGLMQIIPTFLFFFASGWIVDSFSRKHLLILCATAEALVMAGLSLVMLAGVLDLAFVFGLLFCHGSIRAIYFPATQAIVPNLVPETQLPRAIALGSTVSNVAMTGGPVMAGVLISLLDRHVYGVLLGLLVASVITYLLLPRLARMQMAPRDWSTIIGGITYVRTNSIVLGAIGIDLFIVMVGSVVTLLPVYAQDILEISPDALGFLRAMPAFGAVVAGVVLSSLPPMRHCGQRLFLALAVFSGAIVLFALSTNFWLSLAALFVYGAADMISVNIRMTLVQTATPDYLRGRVSAVNSIFIASSNEMGDVRAGGAAAFFGPVATACAGGFMALGVVFIGFLAFPRLRRLDRLADAAPSANSESNKGRI